MTAGGCRLLLRGCWQLLGSCRVLLVGDKLAAAELRGVLVGCASWGGWRGLRSCVGNNTDCLRYHVVCGGGRGGGGWR